MKNIPFSVINLWVAARISVCMNRMFSNLQRAGRSSESMWAVFKKQNNMPK